MKMTELNKLVALLLTGMLMACGGGNDSSGNSTSGGATESGRAQTLRGIASWGGPMAGVEIVAIEAGSNRGAVATTQADGSFVLNVEGLNRPLRLFASNTRTAERFAISNIAFDGQTVAHINEATHAITQAMGDTVTQTRQTQLEQVLENSLANYLPASPVDLIKDENYRADLTGVDAALAKVRISFVGNGILLESRANPTQRTTINTATNPLLPAELPATASNQTVDVLELKNLALAFVSTLTINSTNPNKFDAVLHPDFLDSEGYSAAELAEFGGAVDIELERLEVLRCFADTNSIRDRCLVRLMLKTNTFENMDFGNPDFAQVKVANKYDLIVERRSTGTNSDSLKFAGGQFRPYSAKTFLLHQAEVNVQVNGSLSNSGNIRSDIALTMEATTNPGIDIPGALANQNVRGAQLQRMVNGTSTALLSLLRPANSECNGVLNLVRNPLNSNDCSRQFTVNSLNNIELDSRNGHLTLAVQPNSAAPAVQFPFVRVKRGASVSMAYLPRLNENSLRALHAYGRGGVTPPTLNIELSPPTGFNEVCIATDTEENTPSICVRSTRQVSIPNNRLEARQNAYVLYTTDNEGNLFVRRYNLQ